MKKILVIGGLGYLGGRITKYICDLGYSVRVSTRKNSEDFPKNIPLNCEVIQVDYAKKLQLDEIMSGIDCAIDLVGPDSHTVYDDAKYLINNHVELTKSLFQAAVKNFVSQFIYFSTIHVYGKNLTGEVTSKTLPKPNKPFARAHFEAENVLISQNVAMQKIIIRCANTFGYPYFENEKCWELVVNQFCKMAIDDGIIIINSPKAHRNFIPIIQVCKQIEALISAKENNIIVIMGDSKSEPIIHMAKRIKLYLNRYLMMNCVIENNGDKNYNNSNAFRLCPKTRKIKKENLAIDEIGSLINYLKGDKKIEVN